jgi:putative Holliday junction resolvase
MDGSEGDRVKVIKAFADILATLTDIPIDFFDERMSTMVAYRYLEASETFGKRRKNAIDTLSAEIILQGYIDRERAAKNK